MIIQAMVTDDKCKRSLLEFFEGSQMSLEFSSDLLSYKEDSLRRKPNIFFIQADHNSSIEVLDQVSDIRQLFGAIATIIILGDNMSHEKMTTFLSEGADQFFLFPLDLTLLEDFLSKRIESSCYNAFKYRNIPSRSTEIHINFDVNLKTINSTGMILHSPNLIKNGTVLFFDLAQVSPTLPFEIQVLTTHSVYLNESEFVIHTIFFEISNEVKNAIIHEIRDS